MRQLLLRFCDDRSGTTAIEYGLTGGGIAVAIVSALGGHGTKLTAKFTTIAAALRQSMIRKSGHRFSEKIMLH